MPEFKHYLAEAEAHLKKAMAGGEPILHAAGIAPNGEFWELVDGQFFGSEEARQSLIESANAAGR